MKPRLVLPLSSRAATWLLLPGLAIVTLYAFTQANTSDVSGYWTGVASSATSYTVFSCGFGALAAAVDANRLRRGRVLALANSRKPFQVIWNSLWPATTLAVVLQTVGFLFESQGSWGSPGQLPWAVLVAWLAMIAFHVAVGALLGLTLPVVAAAPAALIFSYVWLGFTWSVDYVPLRYLSGLAISGCCAVYSELAPAAPIAVIVFSVGGTLAVAILVTRLSVAQNRRPLRASVAATVLLSVSAVSALAIASNLGSYPSPPRSSADLKCFTRSSAQICLYPEQLWDVTPSPVNVIASALQNLKSAGIKTPDRVTGDLTQTGQSSVTLLYRRTFPPSTIVHSFSSEVGQQDTSLNCKRDTAHPDQEYVASGVIGGLVYFYATKGEIDPLINDSEIENPLHAILRQPQSMQLAWLAEAREALNNCAVQFPEIPTAQ